MWYLICLFLYGGRGLPRVYFYECKKELFGNRLRIMDFLSHMSMYVTWGVEIYVCLEI